MASTNYKNECKNSAFSNRLGKVTFGSTVLSEENHISSITIHDSCVSKGIINGNANNKSLEVETIDYASNLLEQDVQAQIGVKFSNDTTEYENMGTFTISDEKINDTGTSASYTGENLLRNLDKTYECGISDEQLPNATIKDFYEDACNQVGLTPTQTTFTNSNIVVGGNPFNNNETVRTVLSNVASAGLYFIDINTNTSQIVLKWLDSTVSETFTKDDYSTLKKNKVYGPIDCLVIQDTYTEGENVTRGDGDKVFTINDNYFLYTEALRNQAIDAIWTKVQGLTYVDIEMTSLTGKPYLRRGNKISVQDMDGNYFNTYVLDHKFTYDGSFKSVIKAPSLEDNQTALSMKNNQSASQRMRNAERMVNKITGQIIDRVESLEEVTGTLNDYATTEDLKSVKRTVEQEISDRELAIRVAKEEIYRDGTSKVTNTTGTFDENGLTIEKTNAPTKSNLNEKGLKVMSSDGEELMYAGYDEDSKETVTRVNNMYVNRYFNFSNKWRQEEMEDSEHGSGIAFFYMGGN